MVCRFLKGVFQKCNKIWDVRRVLDYLKTFQTPENLTLMLLTLKMTMILAFISAQRCQTLEALSALIRCRVLMINLYFILKHY